MIFFGFLLCGGWILFRQWDRLITLALFLLTGWLYLINEYVLAIRPITSEIILRGLFLATSVGLTVTSCCVLALVSAAGVILEWLPLLVIWVLLEAIPVFATIILALQQKALYQRLPDAETRKQSAVAALPFVVSTFLWLLHIYGK